MVSSFEAARALSHQTDPVAADDRSARAMEGYRSFFPGEEVDPDAPKDEEALLAPFAARLREDDPNLDEDDAFDEARDTIGRKTMLVRDASQEAASIHPKLGGMPYAEAGWSWPTCPACGRETVFVAQVHDPMAPEDLIQVFECTDPDMELCHQWAQEEPESYSLVRVWRNADAANLVPISPNDPDLVLPAYRVMEDVDAEGDASSIVLGGVAHALNNQNLGEKGWHCIARIWMPKCAGNLLHSDLVVARHGRGRTVAFDDHG
jgi:hypothetical protein